MVDANKLLTAFNDVNPPYMKLGSYDIPWKQDYTTYTSWIAIVYSRLRVGQCPLFSLILTLSFRRLHLQLR
jgi:hypothetical protein